MPNLGGAHANATGTEIGHLAYEPTMRVWLDGGRVPATMAAELFVRGLVDVLCAAFGEAKRPGET